MGARVFVFLFAFLMIMPQPSTAARFSGEYLINVCASDANGQEVVQGGHVACQAYISGILDYHNLLRSLGTAPSIDFCVPEGTSLNDIQNKIVRYLLRNKSEHAKFIASPGVMLGLRKSYPCGK